MIKGFSPVDSQRALLIALLQMEGKMQVRPSQKVLKMSVTPCQVGQIKIEFTASMVVAVVEADQISCRARGLQGIQMMTATDSQRVKAAFKAATMAVFAIAEPRMSLVVQKFPNCSIVSSRRALFAS